jgi:hypothetical protein
MEPGGTKTMLRLAAMSLAMRQALEQPDVHDDTVWLADKIIREVEEQFARHTDDVYAAIEYLRHHSGQCDMTLQNYLERWIAQNVELRLQ